MSLDTGPVGSSHPHSTHHMASNGTTKLMVELEAALHVCPSCYGFALLRSSTRQVSVITAAETSCNILESKLESFTYKNFKLNVNYDVAPRVRPILTVDMLTSSGVLVVCGSAENSSIIQLTDGHRISMV